MLSESKQLEEQIKSTQNQISNLPEGKLICARSNGYYKWFQSDGRHKVYIPKTNRQLAEQLAIKKYLSFLSEDLSNEKKAVDAYLTQHDSQSNKASQLLTDFPEYAKLLSPFFSPLSQELLEWASAPYEHNPKFPEYLIHKCQSGNLVRSKSEAMIDMFLYLNKIPFRYECALQLGEATIFPDFTIRHPQTGAVYYWEHFGMMDDPHYCQNACTKLQLYTSYKIIPTIHLITTYETKANPLYSEDVRKIIEHYFL